jgi:hypothetical protein
MNDIDPEIAEQVIVTLLANATGDETKKIVAAACRADLMWRCPCRQPNYPTSETCAGCREPRPAVTA